MKSDDERQKIKNDSAFKFYRYSQNVERSIIDEIINKQSIMLILNQKTPPGTEIYYDSFLEFLSKL